jgi:hypothetical protein
MVPTMEEIEDYLESLEELFFTSLSAATQDLPHIREAVYRLWEDVSRYGPSGLSNIHIPVLRDFQIPPPPPPVPPKSFLERSVDWVGVHPWKTSGIVVGVLGVGLLVGYASAQRRSYRVMRVKSATRERRQVVGALFSDVSIIRMFIIDGWPLVILGGDHPLGLPLIVELEKQGYIVITSVSSASSVDVVERACQGYVRALVLDPCEVHIIDPSHSLTVLRKLLVTSSIPSQSFCAPYQPRSPDVSHLAPQATPTPSPHHIHTYTP